MRSDEIAAVELIGGSTEIPAVKGLINAMFHGKVNMSLNKIDTPSLGAAVGCAYPSYDKIHDIHNSTIRIRWNQDRSHTCEKEFVKSQSEYPISSVVQVNAQIPFWMELSYVETDLHTNPVIGK